MKKAAYIAGGILIGMVVSTAGGAFADTVKSVVGKKVTGEYTVIVDGKKLSDKGAVIDSRANVPARALSEALGADVKVSGKTITITSTDDLQNISGSEPTDNPAATTSSNKYIGGSKSSLQTLRDSILNNTIKPTEEGRQRILNQITDLKKAEADGIPVSNIGVFENELASYDKIIKDANADLKLIDEALLTAK
ncbi:MULTISPECIES: stalk domain-containing protein [unclassified Paenibacillus]|uniref:stalk domain-containing protein n=1 Tax=unclassified Paenibacillus TaxID=185978 RepID=UPI000CFCE943|nr:MULTISPECIES: stalk domain-containing protein [unclassified Paenibacillus]PRA08885.1 copper amine oxidase [Paenibacillus sp. MYb63]PRA48819.1 copper amine oxidase [Paenibacillus sp. MYb67]